MNLTLVLPPHAPTNVATPFASGEVPTSLPAYGVSTAEPTGLLAAMLQSQGVATGGIAPILAAESRPAAADEVRYLLMATPVHLVIARDDVQVAGTATALPQAYAARALASFNQTFAADGIVFSADADGRWFAQLVAPPAVDMVPLDVALNGSLYAHRPTGPDARRWERYGNELQMLLFALNGGGSTAPDASLQGKRPPDGVWFWGGGEFPPRAIAGLRVFTADADHGDAATLARGLVAGLPSATFALPAHASALLQVLAAVPDPAQGLAARALVVLPPATSGDAHARWLAPLVSALERGTLSALAIVSDAAPTTIWTATRPTRWQRLAAQWRRATA